MKAHMRILLATVSVLALLLPCAVGVQAQAISTPVSGTEWNCAPIDEGTWTNLPSGGHKIRGMTLLCRDDTSDPRVTGNNTIVLNANWGPDWVGPMWGTFNITADAGGSWTGSWSGLQTPGEGSVIRAEGRGAGPYEGLKYFLYIKDGAMQGWILDPHGDQ